MPYTNGHANDILDWTFGKKSLPVISKVYIGLCTNDPEETYKQTGVETFDELSGGGYSRVLVSQYNNEYPGLINNASGRAIQNNKQINWPKATVSWPLVKGFILSTSPTVGETSGIYFYGKMDLTEEEEAAGGLLVEAGMVALFDPAAFRISFATVDG